MLTPYLQLLMEKPYLEKEEAENATSLLLENADPHQIAAFLAVLKYRGETADEVAGMVAALQKKALQVTLSTPVLDIVGTGGDLANTVNISTGSAILAAACGIPIAKHGNRAVSSQSGAADLLEALGINLETSPEEIPIYLKEVGIAFLFAPLYHTALRKLAPIRKGLRVPTIFNLVGPLLNPARAEYALIGVAHESSIDLMVQAILKDPTKKRTLLFHGHGLDELTPLGRTIAYDIRDGRAHLLELDPLALGFSPCTLADLRGGDPHKNAAILKRALAGDQQNAITDTLVLNAGAALWIFGRAVSLKEGIHEARQVLKQGKAQEVLEKWIQVSQRLKHGCAA